MSTPRKLRCLLLGAVLCVLLGACSRTPLADPSPPPTEPTPTPAPTTAVPNSMTICLGQEPDTLYVHGGVMLAAGHIRSAVYDGPIDSRSFAYQSVIVEKLPSLADGDAVIHTVSVGLGDTVLAANDEPIVLSENITRSVRLRPADCHANNCLLEWLPVSGTIEMEQMVVTFTLRPGLTWADGVPVTADDSVFSYQLYLDPATPAASRYVGERSASYAAYDDRTVVWKGLPGFRDSTYFTNFWTPLPQHQLRQMSAAEIATSEEGSRHLLGYGPFTVKEWIAGDHITVERNSFYFRAGEGLPYLDQVVFRFIGDNPNHALALLLAGECDVLTQDISLDEVATQLIALEAKGQAVPVIVTGTAFEHLDFGIDPVDDYDRPDFFADVRMRRAIAMCLDRQQAIDQFLYGRSQVPSTYIPPEHPLYLPDLQALPYDPQGAVALLEEMGWQDADGDGIREAHGVEGIADGTRLSFKWQSTSASLRVAYMQMFRQQLKICGVNVILDNQASGLFFADGPEGPLFGRHFDLASFTWLTGVEPPCMLYLCAQIPSSENNWSGQNNIGYCNPDFDAACSAAIQALPGTEEYTFYHQEAQRIFARDIPSLPLHVRVKMAAHRPEVTGLIMDPTSNSELWNIEELNH